MKEILISTSELGCGIAVIEDGMSMIVQHSFSSTYEASEGFSDDLSQILFDMNKDAEARMQSGINDTLLGALDDSVAIILVDDKDMHQKVSLLLSKKSPQHTGLVTLYQEDENLFKQYDLESIDEAYKRISSNNFSLSSNNFVNKNIIDGEIENDTQTAKNKVRSHTHLMNKSHRSPIEKGSKRSSFGFLVSLVIIVLILLIFSGNLSF